MNDLFLFENRRVRLWLRLNKDLIIQEGEIQGGCFDAINVDESSKDTLRIHLSKPFSKDKVKNIKYIPPGLVGLHLPKDTKTDSLFFNGKQISLFIQAGKDSMLFATGPLSENDSWLVIGGDSTRVRTPLRERSLKLNPKYTVQNISNMYPFHAVFEVKDNISTIDAGKFSFMDLIDSVKIVPDSITFIDNKLEFFFNWNTIVSIAVHGDEGAITGSSGSISAVFNSKITVPQLRDFGSIVLNAEKGTENAIIQLMKGENVVREVNANSTKKYVFNALLPGEYYIKILLDVNNNGQWDPINWKEKRQAETILWYRSIIKVRANWEVEATLIAAP